MERVIKKSVKLKHCKHKFKHEKKFYSVLVFKKTDDMSAMKSKTYLLPNGKGIFKEYKNDEIITDKSIRIVNEMISCYFMEEMGIDYVKFCPAIFENKHGYVCYGVVDSNKNEVIIPARKFIYKMLSQNPPYRYQDYCDAFSTCSEFTKYNLKKMLTIVYKIMLYDVFTMQTDRHEGNLYFIADKKAKKIRISPLFENELMLINTYVKSKLQFDYDHIYFSNTVSFFRKKKFEPKIPYDQYVKEIVKLAVENKAYKIIFTKAINNLDLASAIKKVEAEGYKLNDIYKDFILDLFDKIKESVYKEYRLAVMKSRNEI